MCAELADLAMQLARAAATRTLADWAEPEAPQAVEPLEPPATEPSLTEPAQPLADRETAPHATPTPRRPAVPAASTASYKPTDPAVLFTRLAAVVRDCIALESRLATGAAEAPRASTPRASTPRADPRRALLREAFGLVTKNHPDRAQLNREANTRLDEHLEADPEQTIEIGYVLIDICEELGIELDLAKIPNKYLFRPDAMVNQGKDAPDPRATSPP
jgi:hypothetical protein